MSYRNYEQLVDAIGAKYKAGDPEAQEDFAILAHDILVATGTFYLDAEAKVSKIIDDASGREPRSVKTDKKADAAAARETVNALAAKYGVGHVFDSDPQKAAADMAQLFMDAISRDQ